LSFFNIFVSNDFSLENNYFSILNTNFSENDQFLSKNKLKNFNLFFFNEPKFFLNKFKNNLFLTNKNKFKNIFSLNINKFF